MEKNVTEVSRRSAVIDELGALELKLADLTTDKERAAELKRDIASWMEKRGAHEGAAYEGARFIATVTARENERSIFDMGKLWKLLGKVKFLGHCSVALKVVDEHLAAELHPSVISEARTGPRKVKTQPKMRLKAA